jgi:hypothetical protein
MVMNDFDYTDPITNGGVPLCQEWERKAMKEVCDIAHYLTHGLFVNQADFADRLRQSADHFEPDLTEVILPSGLVNLPQQREWAIAHLPHLKPEQQLVVISLINNLVADITVGGTQETCGSQNAT